MNKKSIIETLKQKIGELEEKVGPISSYYIEEIGDTINLIIDSCWYGGDVYKKEIKVEDSGKIYFDGIEFSSIDQFINLVLV